VEDRHRPQCDNRVGRCAGAPRVFRPVSPLGGRCATPQR
jgi:hypothetical protein